MSGYELDPGQQGVMDVLTQVRKAAGGAAGDAALCRGTA